MRHTQSMTFGIAALLSLTLLSACGRRTPNIPTPEPSASASAPAPKPPAPNPATPTPQPPAPQPNPVPVPNPNPNPNPPAPQPVTPVPQPDPQQPQSDAQFFELMGKVGYTLTQEQMVADVRAGVAIAITEWAPGQSKDVEKNIAEKYEDAKKYFDPPLSGIPEYIDRSLKLAALKADPVDFYVNVRYGNQNNRINLLKVNSATGEVLYFNKSGQINSYTRTDGGLLKLANSLLVPRTLYLPPAELEAQRVRRMSVPRPYYPQPVYPPYYPYPRR